MVISDFLKQKYPGAIQQIDQKLSDMPSDPAAFDAWREKTMLQSLETKDQLTNEFTTQNLGTSTRVLRTPKFGGGAGEVERKRRRAGRVAAVGYRLAAAVEAQEGVRPGRRHRQIVDRLAQRDFHAAQRGIAEILLETGICNGSLDELLTQHGLGSIRHHVDVMAHGRQDPVVPIERAIASRDALRALGHEVEWHDYPMEHSVCAEEIADLKDRYGARLDVIHVLSREPREVELFSGRLDADRLREIFTSLVPCDQVDGFWLCGPFGMVNDAQEVLAGLGIAKDRIHHELFYVDDVAPPVAVHRQPGIVGPGSEVTITLDGRSTTATLPRDQSILDAAEQYRSDLPFACKGGVCGTCRAKVTCGDVEMRRNYALEDYEVDAGFVLTCQTFPVGEQITVDFDA